MCNLLDLDLQVLLLPPLVELYRVPLLHVFVLLPPLPLPSLELSSSLPHLILLLLYQAFLLLLLLVLLPLLLQVLLLPPLVELYRVPLLHVFVLLPPLPLPSLELSLLPLLFLLPPLLLQQLELLPLLHSDLLLFQQILQGILLVVELFQLVFLLPRLPLLPQP